MTRDAQPVINIPQQPRPSLPLLVDAMHLYCPKKPSLARMRLQGDPLVDL
jgi:hypothetical protein